MTRPENRQRILICDDDDALIFWLHERLTANGFDVQTTSQGDQALAAFQEKRPFDFVISDYQFLPGRRIKDGLGLVNAIRQIDPNQTIIVHTGEKGLKAPCPVVYKPYPFERMLQCLKKPVEPRLF